MKPILITLAFLAVISFAKAQQTNSFKNNNADTTIVDNPAKPPEFMGGPKSFNKFLSRTTRYPASGVEHHIQGKVILKMVIEKDGSVTNIQVIQGVSPDVDKEAIRVMKASPKFKPGTKLNGEPVRSYYSFPFSFALAD